MHIKYPQALCALKVVVVLVAGDFKARVVPRQAYLHQDIFFYQRFDVAVDRRDAQARHLSLRCVQHFLRQQGPVGLSNRVSDGCSLSGVSFHALSLTELQALAFV
jgi:hypothetical protein